MQPVRKGIDMGMIKYTILSEKGTCFETRTHYLFIGDWLGWSSNVIILEHGLITESELESIKAAGQVNLYQNIHLKTISIFEQCSKDYLARISDRENLSSYVGTLKMVADNLFVGEVCLNGN